MSGVVVRTTRDWLESELALGATLVRVAATLPDVLPTVAPVAERAPGADAALAVAPATPGVTAPVTPGMPPTAEGTSMIGATRPPLSTVPAAEGVAPVAVNGVVPGTVPEVAPWLPSWRAAASVTVVGGTTGS